MEIKVAESNEVKVGHSLPVETGGIPILLVRTEEGLFAIENKCPHLGRTFGKHELNGTTLACEHHGVQIDIRTGRVVYDMGMINLKDIAVFEVSEKDQAIWVRLPD